MRTLTLIGLSMSLFMVGCVPAGVKPEATTADNAAEQQQVSEENAAPSDVSGPDVPAAGPDEGSAPLGALSNQLDQLNGRLTLVQEQLLKLRTQTQQQGELNQMILTRLQQLAESGSGKRTASDSVSASGNMEQDTGQIDAAIGQLLQTVNELGLSSNGDLYEVATTYTSKGVWVLLRYRRDTGETWMADQGQWRALEEESVPPPSSYAVKLQRADQDLKGYVAVRIDRNTGESWWLNDRRWQRYE